MLKKKLFFQKRSNWSGKPRGPEVEVPFVEGVVTESTAGTYYRRTGETYPSLKLEIDSKDGKFTFFDAPFRIDVGEKVRLYCVEGFEKSANNSYLSMDAVEVLGVNNEVIFRAILSQSATYFKETQ